MAGPFHDNAGGNAHGKSMDDEGASTGMGSHQFPFGMNLDNGKEFARHKEIAKGLDAEFYFARPYHSWERGANENTNGLIRQYIPKGTDFSKLTDEMLAEIEWKLNHRPRKSLGYRTPLEYCEQLFNINF